MTRKTAAAAGILAAAGLAATGDRGAEVWADEAAPLALSEVVDAEVRRGTAGRDLAVMGIAPGAPLFEGEWALATYVMAAAGHAQLALAHPAHADTLRPRVDRAVDALLAPELWAFDTARWGDRALDCTRPDHDHAVLGYLGVALGLQRLLAPEGPRAEVHDAVVARLSRRMQAGPILETYPGEAYPVDHAMAVAAVALHGRATGRPAPWLDAHLDGYRARFVDEHGLLVQSASPAGTPRSVGRGSGTALAVWALHHADPVLATDLAEAVRRELAMEAYGQAAVREYPAARCAAGHPCRGDVDSGPLIAGASVAATGFSLAGARVLGDDAWFAELWGTTRRFGAWTGDGFAAGGPLGNAIMLAMLTTPGTVEVEGRRDVTEAKAPPR